MDKKRNPKRGHSETRKLTAKQLQKDILLLFQKDPKRRLNPKQIANKLRIDNNKDSILNACQELSKLGYLVELEDYKYKIRGTGRSSSTLGQDRKVLLGTMDMTRTGAGYVKVEGQDSDIFIASKNMNTALHGDKVKIKAWLPRGRNRPEGEVVEVLERAREHFMGTLWIYPHAAVVLTDPPSSLEIMVDPAKILTAKQEDRVVVKIENWTTGQFRKPLGVITYVLGKAGSHDIEMKGILINNGFNLEFPQEVLEESEALGVNIPEVEIAIRRDMRETPTFTIDPENARDFDDALSFVYLPTGNLEVGVHIADVTHYIHENTALDKEALARSTSVYLVDRVCPMLPEKLSNELCSLRPHEDKLTFSAVFTFDKDDKLIERWFGKTVIHSNRRFSYEEAQAVLDSGEGDFAAALKVLNNLAHKLRKERFRKGAINFESEEVRFRLDEDGVPIEVFTKERKDAHMLIEDFMLLANKEVATFVSNKGTQDGTEIPFVYRVHDEPNTDKVEELARFARQMGVEMNVTTPKDIARSFNKLAELAEENEALSILGPIAIRTMAKAEYSSDNIGHYGLAFDFYSHFTSPIRRYSDVLAHRILFENLKAIHRVNKEKLEEMCKHVSKQERRAADAERESIKYKQVEFMSKHIGEVFPGFISGIGDRGIFIELRGNRCEGMVSFETMDEPFEIDPGRLRIRGVNSKKEYTMGQEIHVRIASTNLVRRQIEMVWVEGEAS